MGSLVSALKEEVIGFSYLAKMVKQLLSDPTVRSKTNLWSFLTGFVAIAVDEMIHQSQCSTCEDVLKRIHGENFKALEGKVAIITGASNGLGLENARCLMKYGCHVIWAVRSPDKAQSVLNQLEKQGKFSGKATILKIELSDLTTVKPFVESFLKLNLPLHYLICNAGIMSPTEWLPSKQNFELQFATNNLSHFLLTELLMPKMQETMKSGAEVRVVILSSLAGACCYDLDPQKLPCPKEDYNEFAEYAVSKAVDCLHARHLQKSQSGLIACAVHPGIIGTGLGGGNRGLTSLLYSGMSMAMFRKPVVKGAATTMYCTVSPDVTQHSKNGHFFYFNCGPQRPRNILGSREDLVEKCHQRQLELVKPYM